MKQLATSTTVCLIFILLVIIGPLKVNALMMAPTPYASCDSKNKEIVHIQTNNQFFKIPGSYLNTSKSHGYAGPNTIDLFAMYGTWESLCDYLANNKIAAKNMYSLLYHYPFIRRPIPVQAGPFISELVSNVTNIRIYQWDLGRTAQQNWKLAIPSYNQGKNVPITAKPEDPSQFAITYQSFNPKIDRYSQGESNDPDNWAPSNKVTFLSKEGSKHHPTFIQCQYRKKDNNKDPLATWITDGNMRQWEICEVKFMYGTGNNAVSIWANINGENIKTSKNGIDIEPFINSVKNFLAGLKDNKIEK